MLNKFFYTLLRPFLFSINAEIIHDITLSVLSHIATFGLAHFIIKKPISSPCNVMNLSFLNPVGLAAGLDKNGSYIDGLATLGFGSIEIGTITPQPQFGNSKPRLFRVASARAIINRMGFNNNGVKAVIANLQASCFYQDKQGILGLNIGINANTPIQLAVNDYRYCLEKLYIYAGYFVINVSSPNTKQLRQLQGMQLLNQLLGSLKKLQLKLADKYKFYVPLTLKISPDITLEEIKNISSLLLQNKIDGIIATNTTVSRSHYVKKLKYGDEVGGLSGAPLLTLSNKVISDFKAELGNTIPIIGVGGILDGIHAISKIKAGASLVQVYSGLIYRGPILIEECVNALHALPIF